MQQTPTRLRTGSPNPKDPSLQGILVEFASADADGFFDGADENLAVPNFAGASRCNQLLHHRIHQVIFDHDLHFQLL